MCFIGLAIAKDDLNISTQKIRYPMQMVNPGEMSSDGFPSETNIEEIVPQQNEFPAKLRNITVGNSQKLVFSVNRLKIKHSINFL
jgi:hypothetical protein